MTDRVPARRSCPPAGGRPCRRCSRRPTPAGSVPVPRRSNIPGRCSGKTLPRPFAALFPILEDSAPATVMFRRPRRASHAINRTQHRPMWQQPRFPRNIYLRVRITSLLSRLSVEQAFLPPAAWRSFARATSTKPVLKITWSASVRRCGATRPIPRGSATLRCS